MVLSVNMITQELTSPGAAKGVVKSDTKRRKTGKWP